MLPALALWLGYGIILSVHSKSPRVVDGVWQSPFYHTAQIYCGLSFSQVSNFILQPTKKIKSVKQVVAAVLGGLIMGYGARLAGGCNIGALFSSIASLSLSGWVFALFLLVGAFIGSKLLAKFFL